MASERRRKNPGPTTVSYLLRVWRVRGEEGVALRAALKARHNGEWEGFASLEAMVEALRAEISVQMAEEWEPVSDEPPQPRGSA